MTTSNAWLLECSEDFAMAVAEVEMIEIVDNPVRFYIPGAPAYCTDVLFWQGNIIPIMNFPVLLGATNQSGSLVCVLAYQEKPGQKLKHLGVGVTRAPVKIQVDDDQACELPDSVESSMLKRVAEASFRLDEKQVVILNMASLCSEEFRDIANNSNSTARNNVISSH